MRVGVTRRATVAATATLVASIAGTAAGAAWHEAAAAARTSYAVNSTADEHDADTSDGVCAAVDGSCTLRAAVEQGSAISGPVLITVPGGTYSLLLGPLPLGGTVTVRGAGPGTLVDAGALSGGFVTSGTDKIQNLTIRNGNSDPAIGGSGSGGGIANTGSLSLAFVKVLNSTASASGGGIQNDGTLAMSQATISGNSAGTLGGGINNTGTARSDHSTMSSNAASQGGGFANSGTMTVDTGNVASNRARDANGGGAFNTNTLTLTNTTIRRNRATNGGAIATSGGTLVLANDTINNNGAATDGGGIENSGGSCCGSAGAPGTNITLSANTAGRFGGGIDSSSVATTTLLNATIDANVAGHGGGQQLSNQAPSGTTLAGTIVSGAGNGCMGAITSSGYNLDRGTSCGFAGTGDISGVDPLLGPLTNNGGPTSTQALNPGSPAIDAEASCPPPSTDQRGMARPQGPACDIGAFEVTDWPTFGHDNQHTGLSTDATVGATRAPGLTIAWSRNLGAGPVEASPAVAYNSHLGKTLVYIASTGNPANVDAIDAATGALVWNFSLPNTSVVSSPAVVGNTVYFGAGNQSLWAVDATTGQLQCSYATTGRIQAAPVVGVVDGTGPVVFVGDVGLSEVQNAGHEWAITGVGNSAGNCQLKWVFNNWFNTGPTGTNTGSWSPPALGTDPTGRPLVVFGSSQPDDSVYALDARDGSIVWRFQTQITAADEDVGAGPTISQPGVNGFADGVVYINGKNEIEYAIDLLTGKEIWEFSLQRDAGVNNNCISTAALVGDRVVVGYANYVYSLSATTGKKVWRSPAITGPILTSPAVSGLPADRVVFVGDLAGMEYGFRFSDGALVFQLTLPHKIFSSAAVSSGMVFVGDNDSSVYALR